MPTTPNSGSVGIESPSIPKVFSETLTDGWLFPGNTDDLSQRLAAFPVNDLAGLSSVGFVNSTRKNDTRNGTYFTGEKIILYSIRESLEYVYPRSWKLRDPELYYSEELAYGMKVEARGSRLVLVWEWERWSHYILDHVLAHEIGHHVRWKERRRRGFAWRPGTAESEQFAEWYARQHRVGPRQRTEELTRRSDLPATDRVTKR